MKLAIPTIGVLASVLVLASVGVLYSYSYESAFSNTESNIPVGSALMTANVHVTQFNEHGEIVALRQGTNHITETGMSIIMGQIFGGFDGGTGISGGMNQSYKVSPTGDYATNVTGKIGWMEIGTSGEDAWPTRLKYNNTDVADPVGHTNPNCIRIAIEVSNATQGNAHAAPSSCGNPANDPVAGVGSARLCSARMNVTATAQFQGADCAANSIDEAGIFTASSSECNAGTCGLMFARNTFGSVNLGALDTLQLEWEFTFTDS